MDVFDRSVISGEAGFGVRLFNLDVRGRSMHWRQAAQCAVGTLALAVIYYWLVVELVGFSAAISKPNWWAGLLPLIGRHLSALAWAELLNTGGMTVAAIISALIGSRLFGPRALTITASASAMAAIYGVAPMFSTSIWPYVHGEILAVTSFDCLKMGLLPTLLVWLFAGGSSNLRRSGQAAASSSTVRGNRMSRDEVASVGAARPRAAQPGR